MAHEWISPAKASKMLQHATEHNTPDFGFATLLNSDGQSGLVSKLARAKLQPRRPEQCDDQPAPFWPITAVADRMSFAPRAAIKRMNPEAVLADYEAQIVRYQKVLAVVLTLQFTHDWQSADILSLAHQFTTERIALARQLTSLVVVHAPAQALSAQPPHAHCLILARKQRATGWCEIHPDLVCKNAALIFRLEWENFREKWVPLYQP